MTGLQIIQNEVTNLHFLYLQFIIGNEEPSFWSQFIIFQNLQADSHILLGTKSTSEKRLSFLPKLEKRPCLFFKDKWHKESVSSPAHVSVVTGIIQMVLKEGFQYLDDHEFHECLLGGQNKVVQPQRHGVPEESSPIL